MPQIIVPPLSVQQLRQLVAGVALHMPSFNLTSAHVGFVVDKVAVGQEFLQTLCLYTCWFHLVNVPHLSLVLYNLGINSIFKYDTLLPTPIHVTVTEHTQG